MPKNGKQKAKDPAPRNAPLFVAIVGGSGSGKSWLSKKLGRALPGKTVHLSLDSFYRDRSHLPEKRRARLNFDNPACIDWPAFEAVLRDCAAGRQTPLPVYDFKTHSRISRVEVIKPKPIVLVDGLWLLRRSSVRSVFGFTIFLDCSLRNRLRRRISRDLVSRGRTDKSVQLQFWSTVQPMHKKFVAPQRNRAHLVLRGDWGEAEVKRIAQKLRSLIEKSSLGVPAS